MFASIPLRNWFACGLLVVCCGCTQSTGFRSASVNDKFCEVCTLNDKPVLVLLADDCARSTAQTGVSPLFQGKFVTTGGDEVVWTYHAGGDGATVSIDLQTFDTRQGRWFHISPSAAGAKVVQFHADTEGLSRSPGQGQLFEQLRAQAEKNETIAAFLAE